MENKQICEVVMGILFIVMLIAFGITYSQGLISSEQLPIFLLVFVLLLVFTGIGASQTTSGHAKSAGRRFDEQAFRRYFRTAFDREPTPSEIAEGAWFAVHPEDRRQPSWTQPGQSRPAPSPASSVTFAATVPSHWIETQQPTPAQPTTIGPKFCPNCGAALGKGGAGTNFCTVCGVKTQATG